ncbi:MFS transporter [Planotetraspora sp. A-T 1434]|uniref:MFS transporter n=1 Tax=Planotetraspora sp. A-T 1434 TaxID=2979219 RepID=UPI0021C10980|nr:MFS transporter [Planotetraspora sp. A-T 1434]MCT9933600.1 MFS transporter [Planotetraspora sp. A-T 1434]
MRLYLWGQATSAFGSTLTATATSVVAVAILDAGPRQVSLIVAAGTSPALLFGPILGVLADRVTRPRRTLILVDLACGVATLVCAVMAFSGLLSVLILSGTSFALGLAQVVTGALYFSHLRSLDVGDLSKARGKLQSSELLSRSVAASTAGPLVAGLGAALLFFLDALTYLVSALALGALRSPDRREAPTQARAGLLRELRDGVTAVRTHGLLVAYTVYAVLVSVATSGTTAQRAVFLLDTLRLPVALYSVPAVAATLLAAAGTFVGSRLLSERLTARRLLVICLPAIAVCGFTLPAAQGPLWLAVTAVVFGMGLPVFFGAAANLALVGILSDDVGDEFFGRVGTLLGSVTTFASTLGALLGGVAGERFGVRGGLWLCQALIVLAAVIFLIWVRRGRLHLTPPATDTSLVASGARP